jgi:hypothetical protein
LYIFVAFRQKVSDNKRKKQEESIGVGEGMKEVLKRGMLKFENSFFSHVVRCALGMIIPLVLTGGISCAVRDFPVAPYQMFLTQGGGRWFYDFLTMVYEGTYGIFL